MIILSELVYNTKIKG